MRSAGGGKEAEAGKTTLLDELPCEEARTLARTATWQGLIKKKITSRGRERSNIIFFRKYTAVLDFLKGWSHFFLSHQPQKGVSKNCSKSQLFTILSTMPIWSFWGLQH